MTRDQDVSEDDDPDSGEGGAETLALSVPEEGGGIRLDKYIAASLPDVSRSRVQAMIAAGDVRVDGVMATGGSAKLKGGEAITVILAPPVDDTPEPENIPLDIVYEDDDLLVINKAVGMVVHPAPGHRSGTLVHALLYHCGESLSGIGGVRRPGIVHRLDRETSGLMIVAKHDRAHQGLAAQLADRSLSRVYEALVWGVPDLPSGWIDKPIGRHPGQRTKMTVGGQNGRAARTHYKVIKAYRGAVSHVACTLETGRTHQIRVHMNAIGLPLVGDPLYGAQGTKARALVKRAAWDGDVPRALLSFPHQALHARHIRFQHPVSEQEMHFESDLPAAFADLISKLKQ